MHKSHPPLSTGKRSTQLMGTSLPLSPDSTLDNSHTGKNKWYHRIPSSQPPICTHTSFPPPPPQTNSNSPKSPATAPIERPATTLPTAPDVGAAVLLVLGAGLVDDELEGDGKGELEEEAAAELGVLGVVEVVEVTRPSDVEVTLTTAAVGAGKEAVSVMMAVGTEAVERKPSVATRAVLAAEETDTAASEAVTSALWTAAEAWTRGPMGMGR